MSDEVFIIGTAVKIVGPKHPFVGCVGKVMGVSSEMIGFRSRVRYSVLLRPGEFQVWAAAKQLSIQNGVNRDGN